ncbi:hypothetical protein ACHQM5_023810 [Ranunculus cassubicifolius]
MKTGVAGTLIQSIYSGILSMFDMGKEKLPYHKNCSCALHKSNTSCSNLCPGRRNISVPTKQLWKECSSSIDKSIRLLIRNVPRLFSLCMKNISIEYEIAHETFSISTHIKHIRS